MKTMFTQWQEGLVTSPELLSHHLSEALSVVTFLNYELNKKAWYHLEQNLNGDWVTVSNKLYESIRLTKEEARNINATVKPEYRWHSMLDHDE